MSKNKSNKSDINHSSRRGFLKMSTLAVGSATFGASIMGRSVFAQAAGQANDHTLVYVFLRGGADALSILAPNAACPGYADYIANQRATTHIPASKLLSLASAGTNPVLGLHPDAVGLRDLFNQSRLGLFMNSGCLNPTTSHFAQQDNIEGGSGEERDTRIKGGFLNRAMSGVDGQLGLIPAMSLNQSLAKSLLGPMPAFAINSAESLKMLTPGNLRSGLSLESRMDASFLKNTAPTRLVDGMLRAQASRIKSAVKLFAGVEQAKADPQNADQLIRLSPSAEYHGYPKFREAVKMIKDVPDMKFITIDVPGWDDHVNLGAVDGKFSTRIAKLSSALKTFVDDLDENGLLQKTTIVVMSEFGRRIAENSSKGVDHGRGGLMMVIGEGVEKQVYAPGFSLVDSAQDQGCLPVSLDYRQILAQVLEERMGIVNVYESSVAGSSSPAAQVKVFPGLVKQSALKVFKS
jgi:uncharacterized protein (DUF1501 family)